MSEQGNKDGESQRTSSAPMKPIGEGCASVWDKVFNTDPAYTKDFKVRGGFSGTAITPIYLAMKATKIFGPMGIGWGVEILQEDFLDGAPLGWDPNGNFWGREQIHRLRVRLWYKLKNDKGEIEKGEIEHFGQTTFVGKTRDGIFTDEEAPKKSLTDGMSKCLSLLGFGADVHMNLFSDVKYMEGLHAMYGESGDDPPLTPNPPTGARSMGSTPSRHQSNTQGQQDEKPLSDRYNQLKSRLDNESQPIADVAVARQTVEQDAQLSQIERALLLTHKRLKLPEHAGQSGDGVFL
ncbi:hypothetical protein [Cupriavidus sp. TMH.W2]|uniref:hypothetical protein n=1 Tax=Cupriavidus sp. TMH.W2 TaxID=3434465 RepID=UPI003D771DA0